MAIIRLNKIASLFQKENSLTKNDWIGYKNETSKGLTIKKTRFDLFRQKMLPGFRLAIT
jgi:hypothetical protein